MGNEVRGGFVCKMRGTRIYILEDQAEADQEFHFYVIFYIIP